MAPRGLRHHYDSVEFARLVNLSDAVFAIAMTLLVLSIDVPRVPAAELAGALRDQVPQVLVFLLSFGLVAAVWWQHHLIFARTAWVDRPMTALNLAVLAGVALVPYPTGLVGATPRAPAAVMALIGVFFVLNALFLLLVARIHAVGAWRVAPPTGVMRWVVASWLLPLAGFAIASLVALGWPVVALVLLAASGPISEAFIRWRAPAAYADYA
jgi:uncharacterized membrane protein